MPDLIVTKSALEESSQKLASIESEFTNCGSKADANADIWGQTDLASAMAEFVANWSAHREKITKRITDLKKQVDEAAKAWNDTEQQLSSGLVERSH